MADELAITSSTYTYGDGISQFNIVTFDPDHRHEWICWWFSSSEMPEGVLVATRCRICNTQKPTDAQMWAAWCSRGESQ